MQTVPLCDLQAQFAELREATLSAMEEVAASGHYILGPHVEEFEQAVASYCGSRFAIGVGNGTDALHLALRSLDLGPGDEVVTTPFTFIATIEAIMMVGARPVFADIDPNTFNLCPLALERAITLRTRAIIPVHLYGLPVNMTAIGEIAAAHHLHLVEDCAQAFGARFRGQSVGTFGDAGCLSFFPSKNLGCLGDGGMILTNDPAQFERIEALRRHGGRIKYHHDELGVNSRLDALQAAVLQVKLPHLDRWNQARRDAAARYDELLQEVPGIVRPVLESEDATHVWHQYTIQLDDRDRVSSDLKDRGISTFPYYPVPLHLQKVTRRLGYREGDFPHAERAAKRCLSLPMFPHITANQQQRVVENLLAVVGGRSASPGALRIAS